MEKKVAYSQHQFENQLKKMHVAYGSWSSWKDKSSFNFDIGCLGFYLRVTVTMISKRFFKLDIILYYKMQQQIWSKDDLYNISLLFTHLFKRDRKNERLKSKMFRILLWSSLSLRTIVNEALLGQTQSRISRNFFTFQIKFILNHISKQFCDVSEIAVIKCQI